MAEVDAQDIQDIQDKDMGDDEIIMDVVEVVLPEDLESDESPIVEIESDELSGRIDNIEPDSEIEGSAEDPLNHVNDLIQKFRLNQSKLSLSNK
jgi:hypothetical protein